MTSGVIIPPLDRREAQNTNAAKLIPIKPQQAEIAIAHSQYRFEPSNNQAIGKTNNVPIRNADGT